MKYNFNLQLFALIGSQKNQGGTKNNIDNGKSSGSSSGSSSGGSSSSTTGGSSTVGGGSSSTTGGGTSHTIGNQHSTTTGSSETVGSQQGGSHSTGTTVTGATGTVDANTQAKRDQALADYNADGKVTDAYNRLQATLDQKPGFQSQYESKLNDLYNNIMNQSKFSYDFNADAMYNMYKDQYTQNGKRAMQDTMAQQQAMNGGYGSSYAQTAGQQTYQNYLQQLNDMLPTLRNQAYQEYQDEQNRLLQQYNLTNDAYNREYGQYRDAVSDWQADRGFNQGMYQDERNFDYSQYNNDRNFWNQEYWNERNAQQTSNSSSDSTNWSNSKSNTTNRSETDSTSESTTDSTNWSNTNQSSWQDSTNWSNTNSSHWTNSDKSTSSATKTVPETKMEQTAKADVKNEHYWGDSIPDNLGEGIRADSKVDASKANKYTGTTNIAARNAGAFNINPNGNLSNMSDGDLIEMAGSLKQKIADDPQNRDQIIQDYQRGMQLTNAEMEWVLRFGQNNLYNTQSWSNKNNSSNPWMNYR